MLVEADCTGVCTTEDVEDLTPNTELRTGDGCGKGLGCDDVVAVDIVGGVAIVIEAIDDTKSLMLDEMFSVSANNKHQRNQKSIQGCC